MRALAFSPDGPILAASGFTELAEGYLILLELNSGQEWAERRSGSPVQTTTYAVASTPDGSRLVTAGLGTTVQFWDVPSGQLVDEWVGHSAYVTSLAITPTAAASRLLMCEWATSYARHRRAGRLLALSTVRWPLPPPHTGARW